MRSTVALHGTTRALALGLGSRRPTPAALPGRDTIGRRGGMPVTDDRRGPGAATRHPQGAAAALAEAGTDAWKREAEVVLCRSCALYHRGEC